MSRAHKEVRRRWIAELRERGGNDAVAEAAERSLRWLRGTEWRCLADQPYSSYSQRVGAAWRQLGDDGLAEERLDILDTVAALRLASKDAVTQPAPAPVAMPVPVAVLARRRVSPQCTPERVEQILAAFAR